ncbi:universal stress protein [Phenylobacterium sp.]|uniref:universal stress protein n=1 Tax=Phenylobacterium sp. TaxID=1871053 RepID=UPI003D29E9FF
MYKSILIPTDGSAFATKGVEAGLALAAALGAKAALLMVTEDIPTYAGLDGAAFSVAFSDFDTSQAERAAAVLAAAKQMADAAGVAATTHHVSRSQPAEAILATAQGQGCDLIVMASHGHRGVKRLLLGSQTAEVLAHSPTPVLVIP